MVRRSMVVTALTIGLCLFHFLSSAQKLIKLPNVQESWTRDYATFSHCGEPVLCGNL